MIFLQENTPFPNVNLADEDGLLAVGGTLTTKRLIDAYNAGIFPWFSNGQPVLWWSPDPRMVLFIDDFKVSKSLKKTVDSGKFKVTFNTAFAEVIEACAAVKRKGQDDTWITQEMKKAYIQLHQKGIATSVEVWENQQLVGGLYGIDLTEKRIFCGESMFHNENNASKVALYYLIEKLKANNYILIDCQVYTVHLESLGAKEIEKNQFLKFLQKS